MNPFRIYFAYLSLHFSITHLHDYFCIFTSCYERSEFSFQLPSHVRLFATPWTAAYQASLSFTISQSLLKLMSIELAMTSNHLILCCPLHLLLQSFTESGSLPVSWLFTSGGQSIGVFSFSISPSNEYSGVYFRMDWLDLLAAQGTLKSLLQHHNSKASILLRSAFFLVQLSHPYLTTGETMVLTGMLEKTW